MTKLDSIRVLLTKAGPLRGAEVRFMRKQVGMPQGKFALLLGHTQENLCRVEADQRKLSDTAERLARAIVAAIDCGGDEAKKILLAIGARLESRELREGFEKQWREAGHTDDEFRRRIRHLLDQVGDTGTCKGCGAEIWWIVHRNGKRAPYTAEGLNHFADCEKASEFRRK